MNRRQALIAGGLTPLIPAFSHSKFTEVKVNFEKVRLGIAGYSFAFYKKNLEAIISVMQQIGVSQMTLKDFQLPYDSTKAEVENILNKLRAAGIQPYGLGVIYMESQEDVQKYFAYAQLTGISLIIGSPAEHTLTAVEERVKSTGIRIAIHNHGPEDKRYPDIDTIYDHIKNLDNRIGICLDIGHSFRCGHDPATMLERYASRVMDMHFKDVTEPIPGGVSTIPGRGKIDLGKLIRTAVKVGYSGNCSLEYERPGDPAQGISESIGYLKGLIKGLSQSE